MPHRDHAEPHGIPVDDHVAVPRKESGAAGGSMTPAPMPATPTMKPACQQKIKPGDPAMPGAARAVRKDRGPVRESSRRDRYPGLSAGDRHPELQVNA
jgi:hypothetical protein